MTLRALCVAALLAAASSAYAGWGPVFEPTYVQLRPGESATISVSGAWLSGLTLYPFPPMTLLAADPSIAAVDGYLPAAHPPQPLHITALRPGVTQVLVAGSTNAYSTSPIIVVADQELPVQIAVDGILAIGQTVTLHAVAAEQDVSFTWYEGRLGGGLYTYEVGHGPDFSFTPAGAYVHDYWVLMTSPRGAGAAGVSLSVQPAPSRRRAVVPH